MAVEPIDYELLTSTPDERAAINAVNAILGEVEALKATADSKTKALIASFESWFGALKERQSHWTVPGIVKTYRVNQTDVSEAERQHYAIKTAMGVITPDDTAPPNVVPPEPDALHEATNAITAGVTLVGLGIGGFLLYKLLK